MSTVAHLPEVPEDEDREFETPVSSLIKSVPRFWIEATDELWEFWELIRIKWWNNPKEYPNSNDMMGRFLWTRFVWLRHVNNSRSFAPRRRLRDKCDAVGGTLQRFFCEATAIWETNDVENGWGNPPQNLFWSNSHLPKNRGRLCWDECAGQFGEHSKKPFGRRKPFKEKNPEHVRVVLPQDLHHGYRGTFWQSKTDLPQRAIESLKAILPRKLYYGWIPKAFAVGETPWVQDGCSMLWWTSGPISIQ